MLLEEAYSPRPELFNSCNEKPPLYLNLPEVGFFRTISPLFSMRHFLRVLVTLDAHNTCMHLEPAPATPFYYFYEVVSPC
jgi:hypothetical protein